MYYGTGIHVYDVNKTCTIKFAEFSLMYTNIDLKLQNKSHGPMHCEIGDAFGHGFILCCVMNSWVSCQCLYTIQGVSSTYWKHFKTITALLGIGHY